MKTKYFFIIPDLKDTCILFCINVFANYLIC